MFALHLALFHALIALTHFGRHALELLGPGLS